MKIVHRQQFLLTFSEPLFAGMDLAFRTMPVPAGVVGDAGAISAMGTVIEMAAERGGAATGNGQRIELGRAQTAQTTSVEQSAQNGDTAKNGDKTGTAEVQRPGTVC